MKFFVFALLVVLCFEGFYCGPILELIQAIIPENSQISYDRQTNLDFANLVHFRNQRHFGWDRKWLKPQQNNDYQQKYNDHSQRYNDYPQQYNDYPQQYNDYPQQYNNHPPQHEDYLRREPYNNYEGQYH